MYRLIFAVLTLSAIAIILVVTAGPSQTAEARFIRWDCSDWQPYPAVADADNELASSILETLAANRGKTLYCGLDQSDTWTKRQVYDNAHAHNDRDRTQYDGSQGQGRFRGFTAGQEGWLTDGEAGITGVSPERIFEFPQQERRRKTVIIRLKVPAHYSRLAQTPWGDHGSTFSSDQATYEGYARVAYLNSTPAFDWDERAKIAATEYCKSRGYPRAVNVAATTPHPTPDVNTIPAGWIYNLDNVQNHPTQPGSIKLQAGYTNTYTATCEKKVRGSRRR